jgi:drug/metabolite transporter (DMT)-like permease
MPSQQAAAFLVRAAPLTFALLWSSGFIVAKYAAPDADPFTFLTVRFAVAAGLLMVIAVGAMRRGRRARARPPTA